MAKSLQTHAVQQNFVQTSRTLFDIQVEIPKFSKIPNAKLNFEKMCLK